MIKLVTTAMLMFGVAIITQPVQSSPNRCEFIIVTILNMQERGQLTAVEARDLIDTCARELWGEPMPRDN